MGLLYFARMSELLQIGDHDRIASQGLSAEEIACQAELLRNKNFVELLAPALVGDGIVRLSEVDQNQLLAAFAGIGDKSLTKFVPASGAASRMFKHLWTPEKSELKAQFSQNWNRFPFAQKINAQMNGPFDLDRVVELMKSSSFRFHEIPKGLIPFHAYASVVRDAFQEHVVALSTYALSDARLHFTINPRFEESIKASVTPLANKLGFDLGFSFQDSKTDTVALASDGRLLRNETGELVFRPGGHGALLRNLQACIADYVVIKNIDNIAVEREHNLLGRWKRILVAKAHLIKSRVDAVLQSDELDWKEEADWIEANFGQEVLPTKVAVKAFLDRPLRVVGMVKNEGEPGGGPFWMKSNGKKSLQIVEKAEVNMANEKQAEIVANSTHFNPVDLVCAFKRFDGSRYDLIDFADRSRSFVASKSQDGDAIKVLEHPGLWNGSMADWNTIFIEVPLATFTPVKTVNDLLRPAHQV